MREIQRTTYLDWLRSGRDRTDVVKVITGIRRCGKSYLLFNIYKSYLKSIGVEDDQIICLALDDDENIQYRNPLELGKYIRSLTTDESKTYYVFLDEIQNIPEWERVVSTLFLKGADIYITGSNSQMLSTELSTKLSGRCIEIRVQPLAFREYLLFRKESGKDAATLLDDYIRRGGFPAVALLEDTMPGLVPDMLMGI